MQYFFANGDEQKGPFPLGSLAAQGLGRDSLVWRDGMTQWQRADSLVELASVIQGLPAAPYDASAPTDPVAAPLGQPNPGYPAAGYPPADAPLYPPAPAPVGLAYQQPAGYYGPAQPPAGMAIASMVLGIVSIPMMCADGIGTPCAIIAVILGHIARGKALRGEGGGAGMALAGMVCGYIALGFLAVGIVAFIGLLVFSAAHHH